MDRRRLVMTFAWGVSVALGMVTVAGCAWLDSIAFFGEQPSAADRLHTLMVTLAVLALFALSLTSAAVLRMPPTLLWICVGGIGFCAIVAYWALGAMQVAAPEEYADPWWTGLRDALLFPGLWPLQASLLLGPLLVRPAREHERDTVRRIRDWWSPRRPAPRGR